MYQMSLGLSMLNLSLQLILQQPGRYISTVRYFEGTSDIGRFILIDRFTSLSGLMGINITHPMRWLILSL